MSDKVLEITEENFESLVLKAGMPAVLDFHADWCTFCKVMEPVFEQAAAEYDGKIRFGSVDVDEQKRFAISNRIVSIPALLLYKDGVLRDRVAGALNAAQLKAKLDALL